jgi:hypothetical protein
MGLQRAPFALTEHGALTAASVLHSPRAVEVAPPEPPRRRLAADSELRKNAPRSFTARS